MTPEEAFQNFLAQRKMEFSSSLNPEMIWKAAWLEATRQAYETIANYAAQEAFVLEENENARAKERSSGVAGVAFNPDAAKWRKIQSLVRQLAKEYDNEET